MSSEVFQVKGWGLRVWNLGFTGWVFRVQGQSLKVRRQTPGWDMTY